MYSFKLSEKAARQVNKRIDAFDDYTEKDNYLPQEVNYYIDYSQFEMTHDYDACWSVPKGMQSCRVVKVTENRTLVPEVVTANKGFFDTLATVGIRIPGNKFCITFEPHQRRFDLLEDMKLLSCPFGIITDFIVPTLSCDFLTESVFQDLSIIDGITVTGSGKRVCTGAREKLDGFEAVCFGVKTNRLTAYYLWDHERIVEVKTNSPFLAEKVGDTYHILSKVPDNFRLEGFPSTFIATGNDIIDDAWEPTIEKFNFKIHQWESLTLALLDRCKEGVILMVDEREYKVTREKTVTLRVAMQTAYDNKDKVIHKEVAVADGLYDFDLVGNVKKERPDRVYPDSAQVIENLITHCVVYDQIRSVAPMQIDEKKDLPYSYAMNGENYLEVADRNYLVNTQKYLIPIRVVHTDKIEKKNERVSHRRVVERYIRKCFKFKNCVNKYYFTDPIRIGQIPYCLMNKKWYFKNGMAFKLSMYKYPYKRKMPMGKYVLYITDRRQEGLEPYRGWYFGFIYRDTSGNLRLLSQGCDVPQFGPEFTLRNTGREFGSTRFRLGDDYYFRDKLNSDGSEIGSYDYHHIRYTKLLPPPGLYITN